MCYEYLLYVFAIRSCCLHTPFVYSVCIRCLYTLFVCVVCIYSLRCVHNLFRQHLPALACLLLFCAGEHALHRKCVSAVCVICLYMVFVCVVVICCWYVMLVSCVCMCIFVHPSRRFPAVRLAAMQQGTARPSFYVYVLCVCVICI